MNKEPWPLRVPLQPDELLSSFLIRNAHAHGTMPYRFLHYFWPGKQVWNRDTDRMADSHWLDEVATLAGIPALKLEASTLLHFRRILGSMLRNGDTPLLLSVSVFHRTRLRHGLQFCPVCFSEGCRWFIKSWRLGFMLVCFKHHVALRDACPVCDSSVVPHRSLWMDLSRCHQCGAYIGMGGWGCLPTTGAQELQQWLWRALLDTSQDVGPFGPYEAFAAVRSLLSIITTRPVHLALRKAFHLPPAVLPTTRLQFEHARFSERALMMETLAVWLADWPSSFQKGACAAGLTQRTFDRLKQPATLRMEVERLPSGIGRHRQYVPRIFDDELLRLARRDRKAYRALRAKRLQGLAGLA